MRFAKSAQALCAVMLTCLASEAHGQHPPITLLDRNGDIIDPIAGENATAPFSTKQTCGLCHDYDTITKGYHFQMGWDVVADDFGVAEGRPWSLSTGFLGRWYPFAYRQLAKKKNDSPDEIDLTVYDFVGFSSPGRGLLPCGACHPGGGGLEFDRDGQRYDERLSAHPELAETLDGDYYNSRWDRSGVVEADCFICHLAGYDFGERVNQIESGNYRWAVVAGSRLGFVNGSVARGQVPEVEYHTRLFNEDGTITLEMSWPPPDDNCMYCHGSSDIKKRGFSWNDVFNPDLHNQQRISCTACHPAGPEHQIARGELRVATVAPRFQNTMKNCEQCHEVGDFGAPIPQHQTIRPSHLRKVACTSCHIPQLNRAAVRGCDTTTGQTVLYNRPPDAKAVGDVAAWKPDYVRKHHRRIYPVNDVLVIWWGNRDADGLVHPLFLREQAAAWKLFSQQVTDDNGDGRQEVNRDEEIVAGLRAFSKSLEGNRRFTHIRPVLVKAGNVYELDDGGHLVVSPLAGTPLEGASSVEFSITHNVAPPRTALGANGCGDCHLQGAHFFTGQRIVDLYGASGAQVTRTMGLSFGCRPWAFAINAFHQQIISPYVGPVIMLIVFMIVLHYHSYGPKRIAFDPYSDEVRRFTLFERAVHLFRLIAFAVLAVTGLILAFNLHLWQDLLFGSPSRLHDFHVWSGVVFIVTTLFGVALWFKDARFTSYDKVWMKRAGGYLGQKGEIPAGRFNAGQKMFYWYTAVFGAIMSVTGLMLIFKGTFTLAAVCVTSTLHNLVGFFLIAGVLAHAYLGTVANPGTWRVLVDGSVTREWARHHHPNWYRALVARGLVPAQEPREDSDSAAATRPRPRRDSS
jgi:formate dehydrogenase gamma subunit